jgi:hypothetical protein
LGRQRRSTKSLGVALNRAFVNHSELSVCSIRALLLADAWADLVRVQTRPSKPRNPGPEMLTRESGAIAIALFPLRNPITEATRCFGRNRHADVYMIRHEISFYNLAFLLPCSRVEDRSPLPPRLPENGFPSSLGHEHYMVLAVPFGMRHNPPATAEGTPR